MRNGTQHKLVFLIVISPSPISDAVDKMMDFFKNNFNRLGMWCFQASILCMWYCSPFRTNDKLFLFELLMTSHTKVKHMAIMNSVVCHRLCLRWHILSCVTFHRPNWADVMKEASWLHPTKTQSLCFNNIHSLSYLWHCMLSQFRLITPAGNCR
jgi:hypothetical protein